MSATSDNETIQGTIGLWKKKWELSNTELRIDGKTPIPLNQITHLSTLNKVLKVWTDGPEPVLELANSKEIRAMSLRLSQALDKRKANGDNLACSASTGRLLSSALIWPWGGFLLFGIFVLCLALFFTGLGLVNLVEGRAELSQAIFGAIIIGVLYAITFGLFWLARIKGPRLECFESELHQVDLLGKRTVLAYDDVTSFTTAVTEVVGGNPKTKTKLTLIGKTGKIKFNDKRGFARTELKELEKLISEQLTLEFWEKIELGKTVPMGGMKLDQQALSLQDGSTIPYTTISEIRLDNGVAKFFRNGEQKPFLKVKSSVKNFYPCYNLLVLLAEAKMTYKEYCGSKVQSVFRSE